MRQGRRVARNVAATIGSGRVRPFRYRTLGVFVDMGQGQAVAETVGMQAGAARSPGCSPARYHLAMMPGVKRKLRLLVDWNVGLFFGRDASELGGLGHAPRLGEESAGGTGAGGATEPAARS